MGVVYLDYTRAGKPVAVKVIHGHLVNDPTVRNRFRREIDAAIRVSSRCTARVLDADPSADQPFLVTEFVAGVTLFTKVIETVVWTSRRRQSAGQSRPPSRRSWHRRRTSRPTSRLRSRHH